MSETTQIAAHFDRKARSFDAIYSGQKSTLGRMFDRVTRKNIGDRFAYTFEALGELEGKSFLDVGCGSGRYCHEAARRGAGPVVGLDVSEKMLTLAREIARAGGLENRCNFVARDVFKFESASKFDAITAIGFFDYIKEPVAMLNRLRELCSGTLVGCFPARWSFRAPMRKVYLSLSNCPVYFYNMAEIEKHARAAGLQIDRLERRGPIYMLIAKPGSVSSGGKR